MPENTSVVPELQRMKPTSLEELAELVHRAASSGVAVYPIGGGTALRYGGRPSRPGWGLSLQELRRVVDYPERDLTITVQAGLTVAELQGLLAQHRQRWPVDVPQPHQATVGGVVACNLNGPRRYAYGGVSESVLALQGVDGQGMVFSAGARVVKNAAGYNLCRLLAGSLGTLAVIGQVTLRVQPTPESTAFVVAGLKDWEQAEVLLGQLMQGRLLPVAIQLAAGPAWAEDPLLGAIRPGQKAWLLVGLEGSAKEVAWQIQQIQSAWREQGVGDCQVLSELVAQAMWRRLVEFAVWPPADGELANGLPVPRGESTATRERFLVVQASLLPSQLVPLMIRWLKLEPAVSVLGHAGHGSLVGYFPLGRIQAKRWLQELIFPSVVAQGGHAQVLAAPAEVVFSRWELWTHPPAENPLMQAIKARFDPQGILNPGRLGFGME